MINENRLEIIKKILKKYPLFEFLGKGRRGIVYKLSEELAVKIERDDIRAFNTIKNEYEILERLKKYDYFPKPFVYNEKERFLIRELVKGDVIGKVANKKVILKVLEMCFVLDKEGVNQQELTNPFKHLFVHEDKIMMIDFERARLSKKPKNVSQFVQYISKRYGFRSAELLNAIKNYKKLINRKSLNRVLLLLAESNLIH